MQEGRASQRVRFPAAFWSVVNRCRKDRPRRWISASGDRDRIFAALDGDGPEPERVTIDATHLRANATMPTIIT